jgi:hypothetical protein
MRGEMLYRQLGATGVDARNGAYELFKTTSHFDTTARHPDWLGPDSRHSRAEKIPSAVPHRDERDERVTALSCFANRFRFLPGPPAI